MFAPVDSDLRIKIVFPSPSGGFDDFGLLDEPTPEPHVWKKRLRQIPPDRRAILRTYTPAAVRNESAEVDVDFYLHEPSGPAPRWASICEVGDQVVITGPDLRAWANDYGVHYRPPASISQVLLIGDETALPAMSNIIRTESGKPGVSASAIVELADAGSADLIDLPEPTIILRGEDPQRTLESEVGRWFLRNEWHPGVFVWLAGEIRDVSDLRLLMETQYGVPDTHMSYLGYWNREGRPS